LATLKGNFSAKVAKWQLSEMSWREPPPKNCQHQATPKKKITAVRSGHKKFISYGWRNELQLFFFK